MLQLRISSALLIGMGVALLAACSGGGGSTTHSSAVPPMSAQRMASDLDASSVSGASGTASVLATLTHERTIGSAVNPVNGDVNPYGLDVAKVTSGKVTAGDLVVCDFNDKQNVQGTGTSILALHPVVGSKPVDIAGNKELTGCNALVADPPIAGGPIWLAAFSANDNPIFTSGGTFVTALSQFHWHNPFGQAFVPPLNSHSVPAFYVSNAGDGSLVRVGLTSTGFTFTTIVTGFPVNHGVPGSILGPSGLNYQSSGDRLYVVDGTNNALYAIDNISKITAGGIVVHGSTFSGSFASDAHLVFSGAPLNGPISSAILPGGNIALGNTLDPTGSNFIVEISPSGHVLASKNVDNGAAGAIFGMVDTGTTAATTKLYFNDDNDNTVKVLSSM